MKKITLWLMLLSYQVVGQNTQTLQSSTTVYFKNNSAKIEENYLIGLKNLSDTINKDTSLSIVINAYADTIGTAKHNTALSEKRLVAVKNMFLGYGIAENRMIGKYWGEHNAEDNDNNNRKTIIQVYRKNIVNKPIPKAELLIVNGIVKDRNTGKPLNNVKISVKQSHRIDSFYSDNEGKFKFGVRAKEIDVSFYLKDYYEHTIVVNNTNASNLDISLIKLEKGAKIPILINFSVGTIDTLENTHKFINVLYKVLIDNPCLVIKLGGHIDAPVTFDKNSEAFKLSIDRAKCIYEVLIKRGINPNRLSYAGYGGEQRIYKNPKTEAENQMNRRVEVTVLDTVCK